MTLDDKINALILGYLVFIWLMGKFLSMTEEK